MNKLTILTILYSLVLFFHIFLCPLALLTCWIATNDGLYLIYGFLAGVPAFFTFIWTAILLGFSNKPGSTQWLTRARVHLRTFCVYTVLYFLTAILMTSSISRQCTSAAPEWKGDTAPGCKVAVATIVANWMVYIFSAATAFFIYTRVLPILSSSESNIAHIVSHKDKAASETHFSAAV